MLGGVQSAGVQAEALSDAGEAVAAHGAGKNDAYRALRDALLSAELPHRSSIDFLIERLEMTEAGGYYALA